MSIRSTIKENTDPKLNKLVNKLLWNIGWTFVKVWAFLFVGLYLLKLLKNMLPW